MIDYEQIDAGLHPLEYKIQLVEHVRLCEYNQACFAPFLLVLSQQSGRKL